MNKLLADFLPLVLFFIALKLGDIYIATGIAIASSIAYILYLKLTHKEISMTNWINLAVVIIFGGATIYLHDERFIKIKPTILVWCFATILLVGLIFKKNFIKSLMSSTISLPDTIWHKAAISWIIFFALLGLLNLYVAFWGGYSTDQWGSFKVFGITGITLVFSIAQSLIFSKYMSVNNDSK